MTLYTPPALNAVNFELDAFTPEVLPSNNSALTSYTVPSLSAVDFALVAYTQPTFPSVDFELGNPAVGDQDIIGVGFTNTSTFGTGALTTDYEITGASFTNSQTFGTGVLTSGYDITGVSFGNSQAFGTGAVSQGTTTQDITGVDFTNSQTFESGSVSGGAIVVQDIPILGGGIPGDGGGEWYQPPLDTRQRRATVEELKREAWAELEQKPKLIKKQAPTKIAIAKKEDFTEEELLLIWWKLRN